MTIRKYFAAATMLVVLASPCKFAMAGESAAHMAAGRGAGPHFVNPKLKEMTVKSVLVLPAVVELTKVGVKGSEGMGKEADQASDQLNTGVAGALTTDGFKVASPFTPEALQGNDELKYALADVQRRFDQVAAQLYKKSKDVRKGRFTLGDSVAVLNRGGTADALVIVRSVGVKETKGKSFMTGGLIGMAVSGTPTFSSRVALVDAKNGDILFLGDYISSGLPNDKTFEKSFNSIIRGK